MVEVLGVRKRDIILMIIAVLFAVDLVCEWRTGGKCDFGVAVCKKEVEV